MADSDGKVRIEIEDNVQEASKRMDNYEKQVNNFDVSGLEKSFNNLDKTLNTLATQFADFSKPVKQDDSALKELENTVKTQYTEIEKLQKGYEELTAELNKLKKPVEDNAKKFDNLGKSYNTALVAQEKLFAALNVDKSFHDTSNTVGEAVQRMKELAFQGDTTSKEFQNLKQFVNEANKKLEETNKIVDKATGGFNKQNNGMQSLIGAAKGLISGYIGIQGAIKAFHFAMESVDAYRVQERAIIGLNTALKNAGVYTDEYSAHLQNLASEIQGYSNFGDEAILKAQGVAQAFMGSVPMTDALTKAVVDFAAAMDMDLEQAFTLVGKSIGSSTNALGRYGVELKKGMTDSQKMEAITKQLGDRYKGQAQKMADANVQLKNSIGDMKEAFGSALNGYVTNWQTGMRRMVEATTKFINSIRIMRSDVAALDMQELTKRYQNNAEVIARMEGQDYYSSGGGLQMKVARKADQQAILYQMRALREQAKNAPKVTPIKFKDDDFGISNGSVGGGKVSGGSSNIQQMKDDYEKLEENVRNARKEIQLAALEHGTSSQAVRDAFVNYNTYNTKLQEINALFDTQKLKFEEQKGAYQLLNDNVANLTTKLRDLAAENQVGSAEWVNYKTQLQQAQLELDKVNQSLKDGGLNTEQWSKSISSALGSTLVSALQGGQSALQSFSSLATSLLQKVLDKMLEMAVITPILNTLTGGTGGTLFSGITKFFGSANGNVFQNGNVIPFAKGGVVNKPTIFPMANGGTGLMGEAGAEAVMPLRRMSNGRLGVEASSENGKAVQVNIYNQSNSQVETRQRSDGGMDIIIKRVNEALMNERTSSGFRAAYQREDRKGLQAV